MQTNLWLNITQTFLICPLVSAPIPCGYHTCSEGIITFPPNSCYGRINTKSSRKRRFNVSTTSRNSLWTTKNIFSINSRALRHIFTSAQLSGNEYPRNFKTNCKALAKQKMCCFANYNQANNQIKYNNHTDTWTLPW